MSVHGEFLKVFLRKYCLHPFCCYLFFSVSPDKLLVYACGSLSQLLWAVEASELLAGQPEVQVFLTEL